MYDEFSNNYIFTNNQTLSGGFLYIRTGYYWIHQPPVCGLDNIMKWFRLYTDILDDTKIAKMSLKTYKFFTFLLAFSSESDAKGVLNVTQKDLSWRFRMSPKTVEKAIKELKELGIVNGTSKTITIVSWDKRQYESDNINKRVKRYRNKKETLHETLHETPPEQIQIQIQKQIQKQNRVDKEKTIKKENPEIVEMVNSFYDFRVSESPDKYRSFKNKRESVINKSVQEIERLVRLDGYSLDDIKQAINWAVRDSFWRDQIVSLANIRKKSSNGLMKFENLYNRCHDNDLGLTEESIEEFFSGSKSI